MDLVKWDEITKEIDIQRDLNTLSKMHDQLEAIRIAAKSFEGSLEACNKAGKYKIKIEMKIGDMYKQLEDQKGKYGRSRDKNRSLSRLTTYSSKQQALDEINKSRVLINQWVKESNIKDREGKLEQYEANCNEKGEQVTSKGFQNFAQLHKRKDTFIEATRSIENKPKIYKQDTIKFLDKLEEKSFDLLLTDPPYSTDIDDIENFVLWLPLYLEKIKSTGRAYVFIGNYPKEIKAYLNLTIPSHFELNQILVWTYKNTLGQNPKDRYNNNWQAILYFVGKEAQFLNCPVTAEQWGVQDINAPDGRLGDRFFKWQKPIEIAERFIRHSTQKNDKIIDPFAGSGTFLLAAASLGREVVGCDNSKESLGIAEERGCEIIQ